jgi:hypothetical protein
MTILKDAINFEETMREWFGDACLPDPNAQARADICTGRISGKSCTYNYKKGWLIPETIAGTIKRLAEAKNHLQLHVEGEDRIGWCEICSCKLDLKIHIPRKTLLKNTSLADYAKYPTWCWLVTETTKPA